MKTTFYVEYDGKQVEASSIIDEAKKNWIDNGNKAKDIVSTNLYIKPEENTAYYVINDDFTGQFPID